MRFQDAFALLQKIGKSLMLPVSVLPVAGILLGVGSAKLSWLPDIVSTAPQPSPPQSLPVVSPAPAATSSRSARLWVEVDV